MNIFLSIFQFYISLVNCSFDNKTGIWKDHNEKIIEQAKTQKKDKRFSKKNSLTKRLKIKILINYF